MTRRTDHEIYQHKIRSSPPISSLEKKFTRLETRALQEADQRVDSDGERYTQIKLGVKFKMKVKITLKTGEVITSPLTKSQRNDLRKRLGQPKIMT